MMMMMMIVTMEQFSISKIWHSFWLKLYYKTIRVWWWKKHWRWKCAKVDNISLKDYTHCKYSIMYEIRLFHCRESKDIIIIIIKWWRRECDCEKKHLRFLMRFDKGISGTFECVYGLNLWNADINCLFAFDFVTLNMNDCWSL